MRSPDWSQRPGVSCQKNTTILLEKFSAPFDIPIAIRKCLKILSSTCKKCVTYGRIFSSKYNGTLYNG